MSASRVPPNAAAAKPAEKCDRAFLIRGLHALAAGRRSGVITLEHAGIEGQIHLVHGDVVAAYVGVLSGVAAFHRLMLRNEAALRLRLGAWEREREISLPLEELLEGARRYVQTFDALAATIGGTTATIESRFDRLANKTVRLPAEVQRFAQSLRPGTTLEELVETSPFDPFDTIKICHRLAQLGLLSISARQDDTADLTEIAFEKLDADFFAQEEELARVDPTERFTDLDDGSSLDERTTKRRRWLWSAWRS